MHLQQNCNTSGGVSIYELSWSYIYYILVVFIINSVYIFDLLVMYITTKNVTGASVNPTNPVAIFQPSCR